MGPWLHELTAGRVIAADRVAPAYVERDATRVLDQRISVEMGSLGLAASADHGDPDVVGPWLHELTAGRVIAALALTEPRGGSDAANLGLRIERDSDHYVLDGEKASISAADQAAIAVVFGRTGGFVQVMQGFDFSRALIGLQVLGVARAALDYAWAYSTERTAFGQPLSAFQGISHRLAELDTQVEGARLLCYQALWAADRGLPHTAEAAMCKWWGPKLAYDVVHECLLTPGPWRLRPGCDGAATPRHPRVPDRRRDCPDHEDHHRPGTGRTSQRACVSAGKGKPRTSTPTVKTEPGP